MTLLVVACAAGADVCTPACGSLAAGLVAAKRTQLRLRLIMGALTLFALSCLLLAVAPNYLWYALLLVPAGFTSLTVMTAANASVQLSTTPHRARPPTKA